MPSKYAQLNDKEWLEEKYLDERLCPRQIAEIIGCSAWSVRNALKRLGVPLRTQSQSEAAKGIKRKSIFAELLDKEWLEKKIFGRTIERCENRKDCRMLFFPGLQSPKVFSHSHTKYKRSGKR